MKKSTETETMTENTDLHPHTLIVEGIEYLIKGRLAMAALKDDENQGSLDFNIQRDNAVSDVETGRSMLRELVGKLQMVKTLNLPQFKAAIRVDPKYVLTIAEASKCPDCNRAVALLMESDGSGQGFYICFDCRAVCSVGRGRVGYERL